jgi:hypothetical protein
VEEIVCMIAVDRVDAPAPIAFSFRWAGKEMTSLSYQILLIRMCLGSLRPPMEICLGTNHRQHRLQLKTALHLHALPFV